MKIATGDDGRTEYTFHQSWLNTYFDCPELARRDAFTDLPHSGSDATAIGTALHAGAEHHLKTGAPYHDCLDVAEEVFVACTQEDGFRWVQVKAESTALAHLAVCLTTWWEHVRPRLVAPVAIEHYFKAPLVEEDEYVMYVAGTIDYVDDNGVIWDWTTANDADKYGRKAWEHKRWSVQPTAYTYGWWYETGEYAPFVFAACLKGNQPKPAQFVECNRNDDHWEFLRQQIQGIAFGHSLTAAQWPLPDQHVLCSPKWCPVWDDCKGKHVTM